MTVDPHGRVLACANLVGDDFRMLHDQSLRFLVYEANLAGRKVLWAPHRLFYNVLPNNTDPNHPPQRGLVPDLLSMADNPAHRDDNHNPLDGISTLSDAKLVGPGQVYFNQDPKKVVNRRQDKVNREYHNKAKKLDRDYHGTQEGTIGPIEDRLNMFGANGTVLGLVFGAFGEVSDHVRQVRDWIVDHRVTKEMQWSCVHPNVLKARHRNRFDCCLGSLLHRGWARLLIRRAYEEVHGPCTLHTNSPIPGCDDGHWDSVEGSHG
jgi:hypothetical protein